MIVYNDIKWQGWRYTFNTRNCGFVEVWSMLLHAFSHQWTRIGEGYNLYPTRNLVPDRTSNLEIYLPDFYLELVPFWNKFHFMGRKVS